MLHVASSGSNNCYFKGYNCWHGCFVMAAVEPAFVRVENMRGTCADSFPLLLFLPTYATFYFLPAVSRMQASASSLLPSSSLSSSSSTVRHIVDINGPIRSPASPHKRKCRVVSVSLWAQHTQRVGEERGWEREGEKCIRDRRTNDHNCNGLFLHLSTF